MHFPKKYAMMAAMIIALSPVALYSGSAWCLGCEGGWQNPGSCEETEAYCEDGTLIECELHACWNQNRAEYMCEELNTTKTDCEECEEADH